MSNIYTDMATIARALTRRHKQHPDVPYRDGSFKLRSGSHSIKPVISAPVEFLSTTNMLALDHGIDLRTDAVAARSAAIKGNNQLPSPSPSPPPARTASSSSSSAVSSSDKIWDDDVVHRRSESPQSLASPITSPGASLREEDSSIEPGTTFFFSEKRSVSNTTSSVPTTPTTGTMSTNAVAAPPGVPRRVPSHTKRSHQQLSRQRSLLSNGAVAAPRPLNSVGSSSNLSQPHQGGGQQQQQQVEKPTTAAVEEEEEEKSQHPFGPELEKVREIAEEFGGGRALDDEEAVRRKGLCKVSVYDYQDEVQDLYDSIFDDYYQLPTDSLCSTTTWV